MTRDDAILNTLPPLNLPMGEFLCAAVDHDILPTVWANAEPYGRVTKEAFNSISSMILKQLTPSAGIDAVYLDLHGAMVTETHEEGELLRLIRERMGQDIPIVISLDLHANVTSAIIVGAT